MKERVTTMSDSQWNLRDPEQREAFTKAVGKCVKTKPVKCRDIAETIGADMTQTRRALNTLIEAGEVQFEGTTRDMVYFR